MSGEKPASDYDMLALPDQQEWTARLPPNPMKKRQAKAPE